MKKNILFHFFNQMNMSGEYSYITQGEGGFIIPRDGAKYYKPTITIKK